MKFDNAFLTVNGKVGLQYKNNGIIISVWPDKAGNLNVSENCPATQEQKLRDMYAIHAHKYGRDRKSVV